MLMEEHYPRIYLIEQDVPLISERLFYGSPCNFVYVKNVQTNSSSMKGFTLCIKLNTCVFLT